MCKSFHAQINLKFSIAKFGYTGLSIHEGSGMSSLYGGWVIRGKTILNKKRTKQLQIK
jgi:hypothetical protein